MLCSSLIPQLSLRDQGHHHNRDLFLPLECEVHLHLNPRSKDGRERGRKAWVPGRRNSGLLCVWVRKVFLRRTKLIWRLSLFCYKCSWAIRTGSFFSNLKEDFSQPSTIVTITQHTHWAFNQVNYDSYSSQGQYRFIATCVENMAWNIVSSIFFPV